MRRGISKDLGFTADERSENLRRSAEVAKLFNDAGVIVLAAFVAPEESIRQKAAATIGRERFLVVHLAASLDVCRQRDTDGHYKLADSGEMPLFPGVSSPYEPPPQPDLVLQSDKLPVDQCVDQVLALLRSRGVAE
jgi:bifunctional enzyme CysN/CysC